MTLCDRVFINLFSRVTAGGKGAQAGIKMGEQIVAINGSSTADLVHVAAQKLIKKGNSKKSSSFFIFSFFISRKY